MQTLFAPVHTEPAGTHSFVSAHVGAVPQLPVALHVMVSVPLRVYPALHVYEALLSKVVAVKLRLPFVTVGGTPQSTGAQLGATPDHSPVARQVRVAALST